MFALLDKFENVNSVFIQYHRSYPNVIVHLVTTPVGMFSSICICNQIINPCIVYIPMYIYGYSLIHTTPAHIWCSCMLIINIMVYMSYMFEMNMICSVFMLLSSIYLQDISHYLCNEPTYDSTYSIKYGLVHWLRNYTNHMYYLLPCLLMNVRCLETMYSKLFVAPNNVVYGKVQSDQLSTIHKWVIENNDLSKDNTSHWWYAELPDEEKTAFQEIMHSQEIIDIFRNTYKSNQWIIETVEKMNEIYVASEKHTQNSDTVFFMKHIDGPWYLLFPFCKVYRCILAINENHRISTIFPNIDRTYTLTRGDFVGFDFNREIHYIKTNKDAVDAERRITLKLHYAVYPKWFQLFGKILKQLTTVYDVRARQLFLATIKPNDNKTRTLSKSILYVTRLTYLIENHLGFYNIALLTLTYLVNKHLLRMILNYNVYMIDIFSKIYTENISIGINQRNIRFYRVSSKIMLMLSMIHYLYEENQNDKDVFYTSMYVLYRQYYKMNTIMHLIMHMYFMGIIILKRIYSDDDMYRMLYYHYIMYILEYLQKK